MAVGLEITGAKFDLEIANSQVGIVQSFYGANYSRIRWLCDLEFVLCLLMSYHSKPYMAL